MLLSSQLIVSPYYLKLLKITRFILLLPHSVNASKCNSWDVVALYTPSKYLPSLGILAMNLGILGNTIPPHKNMRRPRLQVCTCIRLRVVNRIAIAAVTVPYSVPAPHILAHHMSWNLLTQFHQRQQRICYTVRSAVLPMPIVFSPEYCRAETNGPNLWWHALRVSEGQATSWFASGGETAWMWLRPEINCPNQER